MVAVLPAKVVIARFWVLKNVPWYWLLFYSAALCLNVDKCYHGKTQPVHAKPLEIVETDNNQAQSMPNQFFQFFPFPIEHVHYGLVDMKISETLR